MPARKILKHDIYALIKDRVFYANNEIISADPDSFESVSEDFSRDKNNVFWRQHRVVDAKPESFTPTHGFTLKSVTTASII